MSEFNYKIKGEVKPVGVKPGDKVTMTAWVSDIQGEIDKVHVLEPIYGLDLELNKVEEGVYSIDFLIPPLMPSKVYTIYLYASDKNYKRGPSVAIEYEVK